MMMILGCILLSPPLLPAALLSSLLHMTSQYFFVLDPVERIRSSRRLLHSCAFLKHLNNAFSNALSLPSFESHHIPFGVCCWSTYQDLLVHVGLSRLNAIQHRVSHTCTFWSSDPPESSKLYRLVVGWRFALPQYLSPQNSLLQLDRASLSLSCIASCHRPTSRAMWLSMWLAIQPQHE